MNNYSFQISSDFQIPFSGVNTKPAVSNLFDVGLVDIISGISTGGMYHFQIKRCVELGDLNGDSSFNVLDVVQLSNCVLFASCFSIENGCAGDVNLDGSYNVLDVVSLVGIIVDGSSYLNESMLTGESKPVKKDENENFYLIKEFKFENFFNSQSFVNKVGEIAENEGHHPDIWFGWGYAKIKIFTHAIKGLHESDFVLAAKIDKI